MKCEEAESLILQGETPESLAAHLAVCKNCAALAESCKMLNQVKQKQVLPEVPEHLDSSILFAAHSAVVTGGLRPHTGRVRLIQRIISAAAAVAVAAALAVVFHTEETKTPAPVIPVAESYAQGLENFSSMESELASLSYEIDRTADTYAAISGSSYNLYASIY